MSSTRVTLAGTVVISLVEKIRSFSKTTVPLVVIAFLNSSIVSTLVSFPVSSAANTVIGNKLIAIHNDRNTAKIFFFTCVFLLYGFFSLG